MTDDERAVPEDSQQPTETPPEEDLADLDVTKDEGADVKGGIPRRSQEA